jgi:glutathione S-transferase
MKDDLIKLDNGALRKHARGLVTDPKATQHQKLDGMLALVADNAEQQERAEKEANERMDALEERLKRDPLFVLPDRITKAIVIFVPVWWAWVTLNLLGVKITLQDILDFVQGF